jgi:hypothetical protein
MFFFQIYQVTNHIHWEVISQHNQNPWAFGNTAKATASASSNNWSATECIP